MFSSTPSSPRSIDRSWSRLRLDSELRLIGLLAISVSREGSYELDPAKMEMNLEDPAPSPVLPAPVSTEMAVEEISQQTIIPTPHFFCRICPPDGEDENGEGLVELGCNCKGDLSRMHRTCFLEWFGTRMLLSDQHDCEICNAMLPFETQRVMAEAVGDHTNGGKKILMRGLKRHLGLTVFALTERAVNYEELVQVLMAQNAQGPVEIAIDVQMPVQGDQELWEYYCERTWPCRILLFLCKLYIVVVAVGMTCYATYHLLRGS